MDLKENTTLVIKPADKGGTIVIMDKNMDHEECIRLLSDENSYEIHRIYPTPRLVNKIRTLVDEGLMNDWITKHEAGFLVGDYPCTLRFYTVPNIHKNQDAPTRETYSVGNMFSS